MALVILAHARSGSTTLGNILELHPEISILGEPFNPRRHRWRKGNHCYANDLDETPAMLDRVLEGIFAEYDGIKHLYEQIPIKLNRHLLRKPYRFIFLHRKNVVRAMVSREISMQSRHWNSNKQRILQHPFEDVDLEAFGRKLERLKKRNAMFIRFGRENTPHFRVLAYEDLYDRDLRQQHRLIEDLFEYLGVQPLTAAGDIRRMDTLLDARQTKLNNHDTYRLIPNIDEIEARFGNDRDGYLFQ